MPLLKPIGQVGF